MGANDNIVLMLSLGVVGIAKDTTGDHSVTRLIVMVGARVKDSDLTGINLSRSSELGDEGLTTTASAYNSDSSVLTCC